MSLVDNNNNGFGLGDGHNRCVFRNPRGNKYYYCIYNSINDDLILEYSTNGTSWGNTPQTIYTGTVGDFDVKIYNTGSDLKIFVVLYDITDQDLTYIRGSLGDAASTPTWDTAQDIDAAINVEIAAPQSHSVAIARTNAGRLVVAFTEDMADKGKKYRQTKIIGASGDGAAPTWSNETTLDDPSGNTNNDDKDDVCVSIESFSSTYTNRVVILARVPEATDTDNYELKIWCYDWNGTSMSSQSSNTNLSEDDVNAGKRLSLVVDDSDYIHIFYYSGATNNDLDSRKSSAAGAVTTMNLTNVVDNQDATTLCLGIDRTNDELYAFYRKTGAGTDYYYKKSAVGTISWGGEQTITFTTAFDQICVHNSDVESDLHIGIHDNLDDETYYDTLTISAETTAYKDVALKTTLESALTYKDITLKTTLESIPIYKDITLKTSFDPAPILAYKDVALKTTFESIPTYKDIALKTTLESIPTYKDIYLKTTLQELVYKDIALKTTLESIPIYKDITLKTTLESAITYKDIALKISIISAPSYKDITLKTTLESALTYKDIALKTTFESIPTYKDITLKISLDSAPSYKDVALKTSITSAITYKDVALKTTFDILDYKDIALKTTFDSLDYKDVALKTTFDMLDYKDISLKTTLESIPIYKDIALKTTFDLLDYKDITLKTTIESAPTYKDIAIKTTLQILAVYKDITLKVSLISLAREIKDFISSINQTEDFVSIITQTKDFISKLNS